MDATFLDPAQRRAMAAAAGGRLHGFWLHAPLATLEQRVAARRADASDATVAVLRRAAAQDPGAGGWTAIDATDESPRLAAIRRTVRDHGIAC